MARPLRIQLKILGTKRLAELTTGIGFLLSGLTIYTNHGFESSAVFLLGFLTIPLGVIMVGVALVGKMD